MNPIAKKIVRKYKIWRINNAYKKIQRLDQKPAQIDFFNKLHAISRIWFLDNFLFKKKS